MKKWSLHQTWLVTFVWLCLCASTRVVAKTITGEFKLSGLNTEYVLGSFAVEAKQMGYMKVVLKSKDPYNLNKDLNVRLFRDDKWSKYQKAPSCTEKVPFARINEPVTMQRKGKHYEADVAMPLDNQKEDSIHYYYFVITDCSLEFYMHDDAIPLVRYELQAWDNGSHVSADEAHLWNLHTSTFIVSGFIALGLGMSIIVTLYEKSTVHAAMFWVMAAASCDTMSSFFELVHLSLYAHDGIGSYVLDCLSAHMEALCDSLVALLLLSVASGWTLPSDVIAVQHNAGMVQKVLGGLQSPFGALMTCSPSAILALSILVLHITLAQWGRIYNDDFDSYHDLAHLPGKILMFFRIGLGLCLLICCFQTKSRCPVSLHGFYIKLAIVGSLWFQSLPVLTWIVNTVVSYHMQHWTVGMYGAALQTSGLILLTWLVTSHSTPYHKISHLSSAKENLTDSLSSAATGDGASAAPRTWTMGKTKVRLD